MTCEVGQSLQLIFAMESRPLRRLHATVNSLIGDREVFDFVLESVSIAGLVCMNICPHASPYGDLLPRVRR